jgi:hypothetical protein
VSEAERRHGTRDRPPGPVAAHGAVRLATPPTGSYRLGNRELTAVLRAASAAPLPLDRATRDALERRFGVRLDDVQLHADAAAASLTAQHGALALARGRDVYVDRSVLHAPGLAGPVLAHELAHVVQQARGGADAPAALEAEAQAAALHGGASVDGGAPFGVAQAQSDLPPNWAEDFLIPELTADRDAWRKYVGMPSIARVMRTHGAIEHAYHDDPEFQRWLKDPSYRPAPPPGASGAPSTPDPAASGSQPVAVETDIRYDARHSRWVVSANDVPVAFVEVEDPTVALDIESTAEGDTVSIAARHGGRARLVAAGGERGTRMRVALQEEVVGASEVGAGRTVPVLGVEHPGAPRDPRPETATAIPAATAPAAPTPQETFMANWAARTSPREKYEASLVPRPRWYYTREMQELDEAPLFISLLPLGRAVWMTGTLISGETMSGIPIDRTEQAKAVAWEVATEAALWAVTEGLGAMPLGSELHPPAAARNLLGESIEEAATLGGRAPLPGAALGESIEEAATLGRRGSAPGAALGESLEEAASAERAAAGEARSVERTAATEAAEPAVAAATAPAAAPRGFARISDEAAESLKRMMGGEGERFEALKRSLTRVREPGVIEAINRFHDAPGFEQVVADYLAGGSKQEGARFVMRQLGQTVPEDLRRATMFEVPDLRAFDPRFLDPSRAARVTDVWVAGERIEFKSVIDVRAYAGQQLRRDIISAGLEAGRGSGDVGAVVAALKRRKWVFNATKMKYAGLSAETVAARLSDFAFAEGSILAGHPWEAQLRAAVREMVVFR